MERTLSAEERIRRAEEIYYKRRIQSQGVRVSTNTSNKNGKSDYKLFYKIIIQVLICITIYIIFYLIQNSNYIFSEDLINSTKNILSYDINFQKIYQDINNYIINLKNEKTNENREQDEESNKEHDNEQQEENKEQNPITEENIGGAESVNNAGENQDETNMMAENENSQSGQNPNEGLSQMEIDANYIKGKYSLIKPVGGAITSRFGLRNPTTSSVPKNHTGIDIAANVGTAIYAALDGVVKIASSEGDYGKHLRIEKDDIAIYYAHCSKLCVQEGQQVNQGDVIAEVGATRKCNRSAFAF